MFKKHLKNKKGYTLVELVVYLSLFCLLSLTLVRITVTGYNVYKVVRINRDFTENGILAIDRISREVRNATSVSGSSVLNSSPGSLVLVNSTGTVTFDVNNNQLRLTETKNNNTTTANLTGGVISVSSLVFYNFSTSQGQFVKTVLTLKHNPTGRTENFYVTNLLRGVY